MSTRERVRMLSRLRLAGRYGAYLAGRESIAGGITSDTSLLMEAQSPTPMSVFTLS
jgi:hypothetical protein